MAPSEFPSFPWRSLILLTVLGFALRAWRLADPPFPVFDEAYYVPAAREWLATGHDPNWVHPPLGKLLIAAGIAFWGDAPIGWRGMSLLAGTAVIPAGAWMTWLLAKQRLPVLLAGAFLAVDPLLILHSRLGMLDIFLTLAATALGGSLVRYLGEPSFRRGIPAVLAAGAALAIKQTAAPLLFAAWLLFAVSPAAPAVRTGLSLLPAAVAGVGEAAAFFPGVTLLDKARRIRARFRHALAHAPDHPYVSPWWRWPLGGAPILYHFTPERDHKGRATVAFGNPLLLWPALIALVAAAIRPRGLPDRVPAVVVGAHLAVWGILRKTGFVFYLLPLLPFMYAQLAAKLAALAARGGKEKTLAAGYLALTAATVVWALPLLYGSPISIPPRFPLNLVWPVPR